MRSPVRLLPLALLSLVVACGKGGSSPTGPSSTSSSPTRIIAVSGNLAFGDVPVGDQRDLTYTITNSGNATLTVTGTTISGGLASQTLFSFTQGAIAPGDSRTVTVRFQPTTAGSYSGVITVNGDQTSGNNTTPISGTATAPLAQGNWSGRYVVERCDGTGSVQDYFCSARGVFPPGTSLPISLSLTQNGSSVSGTFSLGQVTGVANGTVNAGGTLVLQGTATSGTLTAQLSSWNTTVSGSSMTGTFTYNASIGGIPGVAVVVSRLSGVTRR
ncbi:MAG: choice-of-anchor D domain-containing protein [Vicinamibacterales bacterium]